MLPKEITEDHEYVPRTRYRNFCTRQLDKKMLIIPLLKSVKQQRVSVYRGSELWRPMTKDLSNRHRAHRTFMKLYKQLLLQI